MLEDDDILGDDDVLGDGDYLDGDDDALEDSDELSSDYQEIDTDVRAREAAKARNATRMSGAASANQVELGSALRLGGVRLAGSSGAGIRVNPEDTKLLHCGSDVDHIEVYFKNGRKLIIQQ